ncbi:hypothetical protein Btru_073263, partial [Bulinus truncatus]
HECQKQYDVPEIAIQKCCNLFHMITGVYDGQPYQLVWDKSKSQDDLSSCQVNCTFSRMTHVTNTSCCDGYTGSSCEEPVCDPPCQNGQPCVEGAFAASPPWCACANGFVGQRCQEYSPSITDTKKYCYSGSQCQGELVNKTVTGIIDCCKDGFFGSWGSQLTGCVSCRKADLPVTSNNLPYVTCMMSGEELFRTFDGTFYRYRNLCAVPVLISPTIKVYAVGECDPINKCSCSKRLTIIFQDMTFTMDGSILTLTDGNNTNTYDASSLPDNTPKALDPKGSINVKRDQTQNSMYLMTSTGVTFRIDGDGYTLVTAKKDSPLMGTFSGLCGDADGYPDDFLQLPGGPDRVNERYKNTELVCGTSVHKCMNSDDEARATKACIPIGLNFYECLKESIADNQERCKAHYCTSLNAAGEEAAKKAVCNYLSTHEKLCSELTNKFYTWRTSTFCPKSCPATYVYRSSVTNLCQPTCGMPMQYYTQSSCMSKPHGACTCPSGTMEMKYSNGSQCVIPGQCMCRGTDDEWYPMGYTSVSKDNCLSCKCETGGLWNCEQTEQNCKGYCSLMAGKYVKSFDGRLFIINGGCQQLTLLETVEDRYMVSMKVQNKLCSKDERGNTICPNKYIMSCQGQTGSIEIQAKGAKFEAGFTSTLYFRCVRGECVKNGCVKATRGIEKTISSKVKALKCVSESLFVIQFSSHGRKGRQSVIRFLSQGRKGRQSVIRFSSQGRKGRQSVSFISQVTAEKGVSLSFGSQVTAEKGVSLCHSVLRSRQKRSSHRILLVFKIS